MNRITDVGLSDKVMRKGRFLGRLLIDFCYLNFKIIRASTKLGLTIDS